MIIWNGMDVIGCIIGGVILVGYILFFVGYSINEKIKEKKNKKRRDK